MEFLCFEYTIGKLWAIKVFSKILLVFWNFIKSVGNWFWNLIFFVSEPAYEPYGYNHGPSYGGYPGPSYGQPMGYHGPPAHGPPPQGHQGPPHDPQGHHGPAQQGQAQPENQAGSE